MKTIRLAWVIAIGILGTALVPAQTALVSAQTYDLYSAQEPSLDFFGFGASRNKSGNDTSAVGPGIGFNYFFTQNFGAFADTYGDAFTWPYLINANGIFRYPIPNTSIAPYVFAGFGRQWFHAPQWMGDFGAGIEYRPCYVKPPVGFFVDARGVFAGETKDYAVVRFGLRFIFK